MIAAGVYAARASAEVFFNAAKMGITEISFDEFKALMEADVRHFKSIEYLRLHDFHRGLVVYAPGASYGIGPFELSPGPQKKGTAEAIFGPEGVELIASHGGKAKADRPITISERSVLSSSSDQLIPVTELLENYISDMRNLLPALAAKVRFEFN
ncbi:MAG: hypothetical protein SFU53_10005 [Terrimicrobiaceae bacterium]|nr:hypothetical protein [Terrimicrobiaceae bacterium]